MRAALLLILLPFSVSSAFSACPLKVVAEGVENTTGKVGFLVFTSPEGWPKDAEQSEMRHAEDAAVGDITWALDNLEPGEYAIVALHDENENMKLDRNFIGVPKEGWGMSNNPSPKLKAPKYEAAVFQHACGTELSIRMRY